MAFPPRYVSMKGSDKSAWSIQVNIPLVFLAAFGIKKAIRNPSHLSPSRTLSFIPGAYEYAGKHRRWHSRKEFLVGVLLNDGTPFSPPIPALHATTTIPGNNAHTRKSLNHSMRPES